jgi:hypothetical protein
MRLRSSAILATALLVLAPATGWSNVSWYDQDFEGLVQADPNALSGDGWLVFGNVFNSDWSYAYGYGPFPAPNGGAAFSAVAAGEGGPGQAAQQLSVYSDYNNGDHGNGRWIESNVFQEQTIGAADIGATWVLQFDAKRGNIEGRTTARAFFKTLDPAAGFALTNFIWIDMTHVPATWDSYSLSIFIDPTLQGQLLQFGFLNTATGWEGSGIFYDNVRLLRSVDLDIKPGSCPNPIHSRSRGLLPVALVGSADFDVSAVDVGTLRLEGVAPLRWSYADVTAPFTGDLCGCNAAGGDGFIDLELKFKAKDILDAIDASQNGDQVLTLTGTLLDGTPIEGQDCIVVGVGADPPGPPVRPGKPGGGDTLQLQPSLGFN